MNPARITTLVLAFVATLALRLHAGSVQATLDRDTAALGETVLLSVTYEGEPPQQPPTVATPQGLRIQYGGQQSQYSFVNGRTTSTLTHRYVVTPAQQGTFTIPPIQTSVDGRPAATAPLTLKVVPNTAAAQESALSRYAFLRVFVPKNEVYVGEVFPVEIRIYYTSASDIQMPQLKTDGFTLGKPAPATQGRSQVGNTAYQVVSIKQTAVAAKAGSLSLGPAECSLVLRLPQNTRQRDPNDPFGDFFGFFESRAALKRVTLQAEGVKINALPLPATGVPPDFTGAVGEFSMAVTAGPTQLAAGDPITLVARISGKGNLDALSLPDTSGRWNDFKLYPPTSRTETADPLGIEGVKIFEQVIVPENSQVRRVPEITFSFFDPGTKSYRTLSHAPTPITVAAASTAQVQPTTVAAAPAAATPPAEPDVRHIRPALGPMATSSPLLLQRPGFLWLQLVPVLLFGAALLKRRIEDRHLADPSYLRRRKALSALNHAIKDLRRLARGTDAEAFYATLLRVIQEAVAAELLLPASGITESVIEDHLRPAGAPDTLLQELDALFQICNHARFAPGAGASDFAPTLHRAERWVQSLQALHLRRVPSPARSL